MDWFKGNIPGKSRISWQNQWFPADFPWNQSIDCITHNCIATDGCLSHPHWPRRHVTSRLKPAARPTAPFSHDQWWCLGYDNWGWATIRYDLLRVWITDYCTYMMQWHRYIDDSNDIEWREKKSMNTFGDVTMVGQCNDCLNSLGP